MLTRQQLRCVTYFTPGGVMSDEEKSGRENTTPLPPSVLASVFLRSFSLARLIIRKEARRLLRIVPSAIIELRGGRICMAGRGLHIFEAGSIVERCGDERGPHRMRRVSPIEPNMPCILAEKT